MLSLLREQSYQAIEDMAESKSMSKYSDKRPFIMFAIWLYHRYWYAFRPFFSFLKKISAGDVAYRRKHIRHTVTGWGSAASVSCTIIFSNTININAGWSALSNWFGIWQFVALFRSTPRNITKYREIKHSPEGYKIWRLSSFFCGLIFCNLNLP